MASVRSTLALRLPAINSAISPALRSYLAPNLARRSLPAYSYLSRSIHTSRPLFAPAPTPPAASAKEVTVPSSAEKDKSVATPAPKKGTRLQRIWTTVKTEASHYWHGTKLLGKEIRISARLQGRLLAGKKLTRREHRQVGCGVGCRLGGRPLTELPSPT